MDDAKTRRIRIPALLAGDFSGETARALYARGEEVAIFVMLQLVTLAMQPNAINDGNKVDVNDVHPSEPSGSVATYLKATRKNCRLGSNDSKIRMKSYNN